MAQSMLEHKHVLKKFWAEAINTTIYLLNQSPTTAIKGKTLEEAWSGHKPKISHLKVFGSLAFVWIPDASCTKLDAKSQKLMLTRCSSFHKACSLIDTETSHLLYNHDVVYDEQRRPLMYVSHVLDPTNQPMKAHDLGVRLPLGPPDVRASATLEALVIPVIPIQTPPASLAGSPKFVHTSPKFDPNSSDEELDHRASLDTNNWMAAKCVVRYVKDTTYYGLIYSQSSNPRLNGFTNTDWIGPIHNKKSTFGCVQFRIWCHHMD